jgi:exodeoxyribonuclease VII small subunit
MAAKKKKTKKKSAGSENADVDTDADEGIPFEKALEALEKIVERLEQGDAPLDDSLKMYEKGVRAFRQCRTLLDKAEKRIQLLVRNEDGDLLLRDADELEE